MLVLFRLDSNAVLGAGHLMRCRALALGLRARGVEAGFALSAASNGAALALDEEGFAVAIVPSKTLERLPSCDLAATVTAAAELGASCVVVDHYGAGPEYLEGLARSGLAVGVVDDLADRDLSAARWILNQNLAAPSLPHPPGASTALGVRFALLRPEYADERATLSRRFDVTDARVLVTLGGGDTARPAGLVLEALERSSRLLDVRVVLGSPSAPDALARAAEASRHSVEIRCAVRSMAPLMAWADVSVNAGGSTCWELACLGVPMLVAALSDDQEPNAVALEAAGVAVELHALELAGPLVEELLADPDQRREMSTAGMALVDGLGADRAAKSLLSVLEVKLSTPETKRAAA